MIYKNMYLLLFNRITDALEEMKAARYGRAAELLRTAQIDAEKMYTDSTEDD